MATTALPADWQGQALKFMKEEKKRDASRAIFGLNFPESWKGSLWTAYRSNQLHRMFGVSAVSFTGDSLSVFDKSDTAKTAPQSIPAGAPELASPAPIKKNKK